MDSNGHPQQNSGLSRFRSAPSSLLDKSYNGFDSSGSLCKSGPTFCNSGKEFSLSHSQMDSQSQSQHLLPQYPRQSANHMESSFGLSGSMAMDPQTQGRRVSSNLMRQSSSPAGLFSHISLQNGYASMKGMGNYGDLNSSSGEVNPSPTRLKSQLSFSSGLSSSLGILPQISEIENEGIEANTSDNENGYIYGSWNGSPPFAENVTVMKREQDMNGKLYSGNKNGQAGNGSHTLSHHFSLPKTSSGVAATEKMLQFQDAVPCKIRAKRGCATHPRSIAERMRRTRISQRMRKLQELVPNMDKQTSTAEMLDLAVEYIKDLQNKFKILTDNRAKCKCSNTQNQVSNQAD